MDIYRKTSDAVSEISSSWHYDKNIGNKSDHIYIPKRDKSAV